MLFFVKGVDITIGAPCTSTKTQPCVVYSVNNTAAAHRQPWSATYRIQHNNQLDHKEEEEDKDKDKIFMSR